MRWFICLRKISESLGEPSLSDCAKDTRRATYVFLQISHVLGDALELGRQTLRDLAVVVVREQGGLPQSIASTIALTAELELLPE